MAKIQFLVMDVDGTLTDGKIYMGGQGELAKAFDIKDGAGIVLELPKINVTPVIITARDSSILENRCKELNITELHQLSKNKLKTLNEVLEKYDASMDSVAYVGDDLPDIPCMEEVMKAGGAVLAPFDAIPEIRTFAEYVSGYKAGEGAIRDCIHYIAQRNMSDTKNRVSQIIDWILKGERREETLPDGSTYTVQEYMTKEEDECVLESHRNHIDVQYMIEGCEEFKIYTANCLTSTGEYNVKKDIEFWQGGVVASHSILVPGSLVVVYNDQPHKGAIIHGNSEKVKKLVCKLEI